MYLGAYLSFYERLERNLTQNKIHWNLNLLRFEYIKLVLFWGVTPPGMVYEGVQLHASNEKTAPNSVFSALKPQNTWVLWHRKRQIFLAPFLTFWEKLNLEWIKKWSGRLSNSSVSKNWSSNSTVLLTPPKIAQLYYK